MSRGLVVECVVGSLLSLLAMALQNQTQSNEADRGEAQVPRVAVAVMAPTEGNQRVQGTIMLQQEDGHVRVTGTIRGIEPGEHGFHIHEFGDLRSSNGDSAGSHFAPEQHPHGAPGRPPHHAGDLGNITANAQGVATIDERYDFFTLHHVIGRALVVHAQADDLTSQPSGNAGARLAVGVIGIANPEYRAAE